MSTGRRLPDDKGPFIVDQGLRLLSEQHQPRKYVGSSAFAAERQGNDDRGVGGGFPDEPAGHWDPVHRDQVANNSVPRVRLDRTVIVNDSGLLGKSTTAQWLRCEYSDPSSDKLAFAINISQLQRLSQIEAQPALPHKLPRRLSKRCCSTSFVSPRAKVDLQCLRRLV